MFKFACGSAKCHFAFGVDKNWKGFVDICKEKEVKEMRRQKNMTVQIKIKIMTERTKHMFTLEHDIFVDVGELFMDYLIKLVKICRFFLMHIYKQ